MVQFGMRLADTKSQSKFAVHPGVGEVEATACIQPVHNSPVDIIPAAVTETNEIQGGRHCKLEVIVRIDPAGKHLGQFYMPPDMIPQPLNTIMPNDKPQL